MIEHKFYNRNVQRRNAVQCTEYQKYQKCIKINNKSEYMCVCVWYDSGITI